jgi:putative transposase
MFTSDEALLAWSKAAALSEEALRLIKRIRESDPARRVRSGPHNISGRYPSRKMQRTIQFASHRNKLPWILEMESDKSTVEYWDLPPSIKLYFQTASGKRVGVLHNPHYFVIRERSAEWIECRTEEELLGLEKRSPNRYRRDQNGQWKFPSGEEYAKPYGLDYRVRSTAEIDWVFQRNVVFLEDYLHAETLEINAEDKTYFQALVAAQPGISLAELLAHVKERGLPADVIYFMAATDQLYIDLSAHPFSRPEKVKVYFTQQAASTYGLAFLPTKSKGAWVTIEAGRRVQWDGKIWEILNRGNHRTWLKDEKGAVIVLDELALKQLVDQNLLENVASSEEIGLDQRARELLGSAGPLELAEANRRHDLLLTYEETGGHPDRVSRRTLFRWLAQKRAAADKFGCGYIGLLPETQKRGNRSDKLPKETLALTNEFISHEYEIPSQPTRYAIWTRLEKACAERGLVAPSYQTFCRKIEQRPTHQKIINRRGKRAAYATEPLYMELEMKTPRHGDRPFEIGHMDHTELDIELICSETGVNLGRPWLSLLIDAFSRVILALYLSFDPPSYRSCMMVLRDCVRRHRRLPRTLVLDGGLEFSCVYFETLLARYECTQKIRPPSKARFGSVCERVFGSVNTRLIHNLIGNTQMTKGNLRYITKGVNPKRLAVWTLGALYERLCEYVFDVYETISHPALGSTPHDLFAAAKEFSGERSHRIIPYNEEFEMMILPTTPKGRAKVVPGRGVKINYIFYWAEAFRNPEIEKTETPVRYDPFNAGRAYAYAGRQWVRCISEYHHIFCDRSERELKIASEELHRLNRQNGRSFYITARKLANYLSSVSSQEQALLQQRRRDTELRRIWAKTEQVPMLQAADAATHPQGETVPSPDPCDLSLSEIDEFSSYRQSETEEAIDLSSLEEYGEY